MLHWITSTASGFESGGKVLRLVTVITTVLVIAGMARLVRSGYRPQVYAMRWAVTGWLVTIVGVTYALVQHFDRGVTVGTCSVLAGNLIALWGLRAELTIRWHSTPKRNTPS